MRTALFACALLAAATTSASAATCSGWKATCESRGGGAYCDAQYSKCMKTGTWTEGAKFGGATHSGVQKK